MSFQDGNQDDLVQLNSIYICILCYGILLVVLLGGGFGGKKESGQLRFGGRDRTFRKPMLVT